MSEDKTLSIVTLAGEFSDRAALQEKFNSLFLISKRQAETIQNLNSEIAHLKLLLQSAVPIIGEPKLLVEENEKVICQIQIQMLKDRTMDKEISFEDAKKLEILVKTLKLIENKSAKSIPAESRDIPDDMLLSLASESVNGKS